MYGRIKGNKAGVFTRLTKLLLTVVTLDAAYLYGVVFEMSDNITKVGTHYHAVPVMAEHILAAVVLYLICMILFEKHMNAKGSPE